VHQRFGANLRKILRHPEAKNCGLEGKFNAKANALIPKQQAKIQASNCKSVPWNTAYSRQDTDYWPRETHKAAGRKSIFGFVLKSPCAALVLPFRRNFQRARQIPCFQIQQNWSLFPNSLNAKSDCKYLHWIGNPGSDGDFKIAGFQPCKVCFPRERRGNNEDSDLHRILGEMLGNGLSIGLLSL
jgi:hypothetical protein